MKTPVFFFALLLAALPAAGQTHDVPPVFSHPDPAIARKFPGEKAFYRFLLEAKAGRIRTCSAEMAYLLFRFNARMEVDTVLTFGTMNDTLLAPFRRRIQESTRYWKPGNAAVSKWYLMPFFSDVHFGKHCQTNLQVMLAYGLLQRLFSSGNLLVETPAYILLAPTLLSGSP